MVRLRQGGRFQGRFGRDEEEEGPREGPGTEEGRPRVHLRRSRTVQKKGSGVRTLIIFVVLLALVLAAMTALG